MIKARNILFKLKDAGYEAYMVGGAVRDCLLGETPNDIDIATNAKPEAVMGIFKKVVPSGIKFGTVTVMVGKDGYEVTTFRKDGRYEDGRRPESVTYSDSIEEDLSRRDFTINAIAMDADGNIIDPFFGELDMERKILRTVGKAEERFGEDALRILRAARFAARFDMVLDTELLQAAQKLAHTTLCVSKERILQELLKMSKYGGRGVRILEEMGVLKHILPEVHAMVGVEQNNPHHVYDVFNHTLMTLDSAPYETIFLAMLFHDTGKPSVKIFDGEKDTFAGHPEVSAKLAEAALRRLKAPTSLIENVVELIQFHDVQVGDTERSVRRLCSKLKHSTFNQLMDVKLADAYGQTPSLREDKYAHVFRLLEISRMKEAQGVTLKDLAVNGHDLMERGLIGPKIGETLSHLLEVVIGDPTLNSKETLLSYVSVN